MHLLAQFSASQLFLVGLLVTSGLMLYHAQRRWQRVAPARPTGRFAEAAQRWQRPHPAQTPADVKQWEVQTHELAREVIARMDSKMAALEHLMRAAHQETLRLEAAIADARAAGLREESANFTPITQAQRLEDAARGMTRSERDAAVPKPHFERPTPRIHALADGGIPAAQIAAETGTPLGEVELILGLRTPSPSGRGLG
jgi:hypothetical protein